MTLHKIIVLELKGHLLEQGPIHILVEDMICFTTTVSFLREELMNLNVGPVQA
jgi:hypothetical protein